MNRLHVLSNLLYGRLTKVPFPHLRPQLIRSRINPLPSSFITPIMKSSIVNPMITRSSSALTERESTELAKLLENKGLGPSVTPDGELVVAKGVPALWLAIRDFDSGLKDSLLKLRETGKEIDSELIKEIEYVAELLYSGVGVVLQYKEGKLTSILLRNTDVDITPLLDPYTVHNLPRTIENFYFEVPESEDITVFTKVKRLQIHAELAMSTAQWKALNKRIAGDLTDGWLSPGEWIEAILEIDEEGDIDEDVQFDPRMEIPDRIHPSELIDEPIEFYMMSHSLFVTESENLKERPKDDNIAGFLFPSEPTQTHCLGVLARLGFSKEENVRVFNTIEGATAFASLWKGKYLDHPITTDGIMIKTNLMEHQALLEEAEEQDVNPWMLSIKFNTDDILSE